MRILQIAPPWFAVPPVAYGGTEAVVALLADGMVRAGHDVTLFASGGSRTLARLESVFDQPPSARLGEQWPDLRHALAAYAIAGEFDVVHDHSGIIGPALGAVLAQAQVIPPVVHTLHGPWHGDACALYAALPAAGPGSQGGGLRLVAISEDQASRAPAGVRVSAVVHNGIAVDDFRFSARRRGGGALAFVGRAHPDKGPAAALRIAKLLNRPLRMAIKVNEAEERRYFDEVLRPLMHGVDVDVAIDAPFAHKTELMASADVLLMPLAWHEPFGLVMAEAMACGTPVAAYAMGAAPELVDHGRTGFVLPPGDLHGLCDAVERAEMIDPLACRSRVETLFSAEVMVDGYLRLYEKALSRLAA